MMAAGKAAEGGAKVLLIEKMSSLGRKLLITGKGRCNITNMGTRDNFFNNINSNPKFFYSAFDVFNNHQLIAFLEGLGVRTKVERGDRVFPRSDDSQEVLKALQLYLKEKGVKIVKGVKVTEILTEKDKVRGVKGEGGETIKSSGVILATGGASYPGTGSTGEGYGMARQLGHTLIALRPGLVPLEVKEDWVKELQGLTLKNVTLKAYGEGELLESQFGEMLFTHFGVSGPITLSLSNKVVDALEKGQKVELKLNLKPALTLDQVDKRLQRDFEKYSRKQFKNSLHEFLPRRLIPPVINLSRIKEDKPVNQISREERLNLAKIVTGMVFRVERSLPLKDAIITRGGIKVKEVDPRTMESRLINNLYFAGEVLDLDANTGGYNLQIAFSTGYVAGKSGAKKIYGLHGRNNHNIEEI